MLWSVAAGQVSLAGAGSGTDRRCLCVSMVLPSFSFHNVQPWLWSRLLDNTYFLVPFVSLKSHDREVGEVWHADRGLTFAVGV